MLIDTEWADAYFIQATAWYLEMNIQIMDTKCKEEEPFYTIDGDLSGQGCTDILYIGYLSDVHYQSLLIDYIRDNMDISASVENMDIDEEDLDIKVRDEKANTIKKQKLQNNEETGKMDDYSSGKQEDDDRCPVCLKTFKKVLTHIKRSKKCQVTDADLRKLEEKSRMKKNESSKKYYSKLKEDAVKMRKKNEQKAESKEKLKNKDPEAWRLQTKKDNESRKLSQDKTVADRLRKFREAVMYGPMFLCVSCHGKMFRNSVKILTNRVVDQIDEKIHIENCIDFDVVTRVVTESRHCNWPPLFKRIEVEVGERFICETCLSYLRVGKLPPKSFKNNLELHYTDKDLKEQDMRLTELEASLIAQNIVFQKIYQLPKSRWTGLKDKVINVPISNARRTRI